MVKTIESGKANWLDKSKGSKFKDEGKKAVDKWASNTGKAFGVTVGSKSKDSFTRGIDATDVSARDAQITDANWDKLVRKAKDGLAR